MKTVAFVTATYPYNLNKDQFIDAEIPVWVEFASRKLCRLILLPKKKAGGVRSLPSEVELNMTLVDKGKHTRGLIRRLLWFFVALFHPVVWREFGILRRLGKLSVQSVFRSIDRASYVLMYRSILKSLIEKEAIDVIYTYWNNEVSYAAAMLKKELPSLKVFSRLHRVDLYEEARSGSYMPYIRQFVNDFDGLFPISEQGNRYLIERYSASQRNIECHYLGVSSCAGDLAGISDSEELYLLSISGCGRVKRIDRIISLLQAFSKKYPEITVRWTHIGGGPLLGSLEASAEALLSDYNVAFEFTGAMPNESVHEYFLNNKVDVLINSSESEGVPVSIMEAMSYGAIIFATDVGGVSELLVEGASYLASNDFLIEDWVEGLASTYSMSKDWELRQKNVAQIRNNFHSAKNHNVFIQKLIA